MILFCNVIRAVSVLQAFLESDLMSESSVWG
jgi:hypothetical protein